MTHDEIKELAIKLLREEEDFMTPLIKLHELMGQEQESFTLESEDLSLILKSDERFKLIEPEDHDSWPDEQDAAMRELGYYKGPRIMLVERTPSKEELFAALAAKMQRSMDALKSAYDSKPESYSEDEEQQLFEVMRKTKEFQEKINDMSKNKRESEE